MADQRTAYVVCRDVLFAHWPIDVEQLRPYIPKQLTIETFDGSAWLGILVVDVAEAGLHRLPFRSSFPSLNLRTYVNVDSEPGVYFLDLDTTEQLGALIGRNAFGLPYHQARMNFSRHNGKITFESRRTDSDLPARFEVTYQPSPESNPFEAEPKSIEDFLIERSRFYVSGGRSGVAAVRPTTQDAILEATIDKDPWSLQQAVATIHTNTLFDAIDLSPTKDEPLCHYSRQQYMFSESLRDIDEAPVPDR
ncbi:YqjF family protein [Halococcus sp. AFM35]|uniref:YqjF family protein n=1 Tax=Halococcus sp. AFM35 TaxID=3421653 RepID=UPI003EBE21EE